MAGGSAHFLCYYLNSEHAPFVVHASDAGPSGIPFYIFLQAKSFLSVKKAKS